MTARALQVSVTELLRHPGERRPVRREVELDGLAITTAHVPAGEPIVVDLELESLSTELAVYGTVRAPYVGECRRCLRDVRGEAEVQVREIFEHHPTEGETYQLDRDVVDLEPMVRDAVLLALPLSPLCAEDCRGPAPEVFPATVASDEPGTGSDSGVEDEGDGVDGADGTAGPGPGTPAADDPPRDPRWAALDQLRLE